MMGWIFDLTGKQGKTKAARRIVPIHPFLIDDLNFIGYVEAITKKKNKQVFPELTKTKDGYGRKISRWFNDGYKQKCGIVSPDDRMRDFHSLRATFITELRRKKVHLRMLKEVVGHSVHIDITDDYTDPYPAKQLYEEVTLKADFHEQIDLSHLKGSKYVIKG